MKRQHGFTLAEMIVALAVSSLLVTLTYGALRIGIRSWDASQETVTQIETLRVGWQAVHSAISEAVVRFDPTTQSEGIFFDGRPDRLKFTANMPSHLGLGGVYIIELLLDTQNGDDAFLLRRTLWVEHLQETRENNPQQAPLAEGVKQIRFRYFGTLNEEETPSWHTQWTGQSTLPNLLRLDVELKDGTHWPTLIARPRISPLIELPDEGSALPLETANPEARL